MPYPTMSKQCATLTKCLWPHQKSPFVICTLPTGFICLLHIAKQLAKANLQRLVCREQFQHHRLHCGSHRLSEKMLRCGTLSSCRDFHIVQQSRSAWLTIELVYSRACLLTAWPNIDEPRHQFRCQIRRCLYGKFARCMRLLGALLPWLKHFIGWKKHTHYAHNEHRNYGECSISVTLLHNIMSS